MAWALVMLINGYVAALVVLQAVRPTQTVSYLYEPFVLAGLLVAISFKTGAAYSAARRCRAQSWVAVLQHLSAGEFHRS